jgi:phosphatidylglycerophosphate synthase
MEAKERMIGELSNGLCDVILIAVALSVLTVNLIIHSWSVAIGSQIITVTALCILLLSSAGLIFLQTKYYNSSWKHRLTLFILFMFLSAISLFWIGLVAATMQSEGDVFKPSEYFSNTWDLWFNFSIQCILFIRHCVCIIRIVSLVRNELAEQNAADAVEEIDRHDSSQQANVVQNVQINIEFQAWNAQQNHLRRNPHMINNRPRLQKLTQSQLETLPVSYFNNRILDPRSPATFRRSEDLPTAAENCLVCQDMFQENAVVRTLPCFHRFHRACVDQWIVDHATCPTCRLDLASNLIEMQSVNAV